MKISINIRKNLEESIISVIKKITNDPKRINK